MTNVDSYFFHSDHNTLTVEDIRKHGFAAKKASNGFIEAYPSLKIIIAEKELELKRDLNREESIAVHDTYEKQFLELLIGGVKDGCPHIMHFEDDGDGVYKLTIFHTPTLKEKFTTHIFNDNLLKISEKMEAIYGIREFYDHIGFTRHTEYDLITEEQRAKTKSLIQELQDHEYHVWLKTFAALDERQKLKLLMDSINMNNSTFRRSSISDQESYEIVKFIERYIDEA